MSSFGAWAGTLGELGPWNFYPFDKPDGFFVDYPPGYLYVLWILGWVSDALRGSTPPELWLKLPPIFADLGLAWLVGLAAERLAPGRPGTRPIPMRTLGAATILLNPAIFFVSAVWGQADSVLAVLVVGGFLLLGTGAQNLRREAAAMVLLAVAIGTKPQAIFAIPIVVLLLVWRHVRHGIDAAEGVRDKRRAAWLGWGRVALLGALAVLTGILLFLPFKLFPLRAVEFYSQASGTYRNTSIFAFNFWGAVGFWRPDSGADAYTFLGVAVVWWGIALFVSFGALVLARAWASLRSGQDEGRVLFFGGVAITLVSFAVVTRVHERYLFLPVALLATLSGLRWLRRAFVALSVLYLINVYFPWVYYLRTVKRPAITFGGAFDVFYGTDIYGTRIRALCLLTGLVCMLIAWRGWRTIEAVAAEPSADLAADPAVAEPPGLPMGGLSGTDPSSPWLLPEPESVDVVPERRPWTLHLHPVRRRGALIALAIFVAAFLLRLIGLGHPPGMYFDEVYHARTGAEYLAHKEVFEYTHPPLAKQLIGFSIQHLSGFGTGGGAGLPADLEPSTLAPRSNGVVWARIAGAGSRIMLGRIDQSCRTQPLTTFAEVDMRVNAIAATDAAVFVAGAPDDQPVVARIEHGNEMWRANLPDVAKTIAVVGDRIYVVTESGDLVAVTSAGEPDTIAVGAGAISASGPDGEVWASFPDQREIASWGPDGQRKHVIAVDGAPAAIAAHKDSERVFVSIGERLVSYDTKGESKQAEISGGAQLLTTVPEQTLVWAVDDRRVRAIEPHSGVVIGETSFDVKPQLLSADPVRHRLLAASGDGLECASGRPQFAWRFGSTLAGALMVAMAFLLAFRLTGSMGAGLLASLFLAIDGLTFTLARIAMNDSYATGFMLASWFCAISALYAWGRKRPDDDGSTSPPQRLKTIAWLLAGGVFGGLGLASKWPVIYGLAAIGLLMMWDGFSRRETSIWRVAGGFLPSVLVMAFCYAVIPLGIYLLTYAPYSTLGHDFAEFLKLQQSMFDYHSTLTATHPFGSPWYGWPFGYRAVYLFVHASTGGRAEIWTIPNLVVTFGGLVAMGALAHRALRLRSVALAVVVVGAAVQYLPWIAVTRVTFMYHYLPVVPFLAIALAWLVTVGLRGWKYQKAAIVGVTSAAIAMFAFIYPMLVGWTMPIWYLDLVRDVLPWVIP